MDYFSREMVMLYGVFGTLIVGGANFLVSRNTNKRTVFVNAITSERVKWMGELKELLSEYLSITSYYEDKPFFEGEEKIKYFERLLYLQNRIKLHLNYIDKKDEEINNLIQKINNKIFGIYEAKKITDLPPQKRFDALPEEQKKKYFDKVLREKVNIETAKKILTSNDHSSLVRILMKVTEEIDKDFKKQFGYSGRDELVSNVNELVEKSRIYLKVEWEKVKNEAQNGKLKKNNWINYKKWGTKP